MPSFRPSFDINIKEAFDSLIKENYSIFEGGTWFGLKFQGNTQNKILMNCIMEFVNHHRKEFGKCLKCSKII